MSSLVTVGVKSWCYARDGLLSPRQNVAYVGGWLGHQNLGDEALFAAFRRLFPHYSLWHYDGSRTHELLLSLASRTRTGLFAGGTLINRAPEYLDLARRFVAGGRSLHFFGVGVADPAFWTGRGDFVDSLYQWRSVFSHCESVGVRGPRSAELLLSAGVRSVEVVGDPVLAFAQTLPQTDQPSTPTLGLNIGFDHGNQWGDPAHVRQQMARLARRAIKAGWRVKWLVVYPPDEPITREIAAETATEEDIFHEFRNARRYIEQVATTTAFVGMKLHATMLALCAGVPSLMLEYDPKCADFMDSINAHDDLIRTDRFNGDEAWERVELWHTDRHDRVTELRRSILGIQQRQRDAASKLAAVMAVRH